MKIWLSSAFGFLALCAILFFGLNSVLHAEVTDAHRERVQEFYIAYYGRPADPAGLDYWAQKLADNDGELSEIIDSFGNSEEFQNRFGSFANESLIKNIYFNLFGRIPDSAGLGFYVDRLENNESTLPEIALQVLDGATGTDREILERKRAVAAYFTDNFRETGQSYGAGEIDFAVGLLVDVDESADSTATVKSQIDDYLGINQPEPEPEPTPNPTPQPEPTPDPVPQNVAPTANAGTDQSVVINAGTVTLDASGSRDPDGSIASYLWVQTAGTTVTLSDASSVSPTFTAPSAAGTLTFEVVVTDNAGAVASDSVEVVVSEPQMEVINGITVPPEPDETENNATIAGVDVNENGIRDDVERLIAREFGDDPVKFEQANEIAKAEQIAITNPNQENIDHSTLILECAALKGIFDADGPKVTEKIVNTDDRIKSYQKVLLMTKSRGLNIENCP